MRILPIGLVSVAWGTRKGFDSRSVSNKQAGCRPLIFRLSNGAEANRCTRRERGGPAPKRQVRDNRRGFLQGREGFDSPTGSVQLRLWSERIRSFPVRRFSSVVERPQE